MTTENQDDFRPLTKPDHWLEWLGDDPAAAIRRQIERLLQQQVGGSVLRWVRLQGTPHFLTGGRKVKADGGEQLQVSRAGLAAPFKLVVKAPDETEHLLNGVFSWVAAGLDGAQRKDRTYLDIDIDPAKADEELPLRIEEVAMEGAASHPA